MRSLLVVLDHPLAHDLAHLVEITKQIQVHDLVAQATVEASDVGVPVCLHHATNVWLTNYGPLSTGRRNGDRNGDRFI